MCAKYDLTLEKRPEIFTTLNSFNSTLDAVILSETVLENQRCCHFLLLENMNISIWIKPKSHKTMHSNSMAMLHDMRVGLLCDAYLTIWVRTTISSPKGLFPREILNSQITPLGRRRFFDRHWPWDIWSYFSRLLVKPNFFKQVIFFLVFFLACAATEYSGGWKKNTNTY